MKVSIINVDNIPYVIKKRVDNYLLLVDINNPENFMIHKVIKNNNKESLIPLDNQEEFINALNKF